ncbi:AT-hook motif nuclear-localized protein 17 [Glycine max]|nr:AT-hook motif nuclear-localized protein 17 [Glycine max]
MPPTIHHHLLNLFLPTQLPRKPCGRPPGSKNKHKIISLPVAQPSESFLRIVIINVDSGKDIIESIADVAGLGHANLAVLSPSGTITRVTLHNSLHGATALTLNGPTLRLAFPQQLILIQRPQLPPPLSFGIHLTTSRGLAIGGAIGGQVNASDEIKITLCTFWNPEIYKYIPEGSNGDNDDNNISKKNYKNNPIDCNGVETNWCSAFSCGIHGWQIM